MKKPLIIIIILLVVVVLLMFARDYFAEEETTTVDEEEWLSDLPSCGDQMEFFSVAPLNFSEITSIVPLGSVSPPSHIFPISRVYMWMIIDADTGIAAVIPVVFPGDVWVTSIIRAQDETGPLSDFTVSFHPCKEVSLSFGHLTSISEKLLQAYNEAEGNCVAGDSAGNTYQNCTKQIMVKVSAGELIGYSGGELRSNFDLIASDFRNTPRQHANPERWEDYQSSLYTTCPLDYFTPEIRKQFEDKIGKENQMDSITGSAQPICGTINKDVYGTAQGIWFAQGIEKTTPEEPHLALVPHFFDATVGVFSMGSSLAGMEIGRYYVGYQDGSINTDFKEIVPGDAYCFEARSGSNYYDNVIENQGGKHDFTILMKLADADTLHIEKVGLNECGDGPWELVSPSTFVR